MSFEYILFTLLGLSEMMYMHTRQWFTQAKVKASIFRLSSPKLDNFHSRLGLRDRIVLRRQASTNCPEGMKILLKNELSCVI
jgi:hypothetical protein